MGDYSITLSTWTRIDFAIVGLSALAVLLLMTSSNFGRLLNREVGGFGASQDLVNEGRSIAEDVDEISP